MGVASSLPDPIGLSAAEVARIGAALYQGVTYRGRPAWQTWLAEGLGVTPPCVRRWLATGVSRAVMPPTTVGLLLAAEKVAGRLAMWEQPRGTLITERMAMLISDEAVAEAPQRVAV